MEVVYYGRACVGTRIGDTHLLIGPFTFGNPSANRINVNDIPADYILITMVQQDHIYDVESIAKHTSAEIISNCKISNHYFDLGIENSHPVDLGGAYNFPFGSTKMVPALHSSTFDNSSTGGCACGLIIRTLDKVVCVVGATALYFNMQLTPVRYKVDLTVLSIDDNFTMDVEDAIMASDFVKCNKVLGCHYDVNPFIKIDDKDLVVRGFRAKGKKLILLGVGQKVLA